MSWLFSSNHKDIEIIGLYKIIQPERRKLAQELELSQPVTDNRLQWWPKLLHHLGKNTVIHSLFTVCEQNWTLYLFFSLSFALFICLVWKFMFLFSAIV